VPDEHDGPGDAPLGEVLGPLVPWAVTLVAGAWLGARIGTAWAGAVADRVAATPGPVVRAVLVVATLAGVGLVVGVAVAVGRPRRGAGGRPRRGAGGRPRRGAGAPGAVALVGLVLVVATVLAGDGPRPARSDRCRSSRPGAGPRR
jgi:hypothetical protein